MRGISFKAILVGLVGVCAVCPIVAWAELVIQHIQIGILQFPPVLIGLFLFLVVANLAVRRICRALGLGSADIMIVYCMMLIATMIASRGLMDKWFGTLAAVNYYTTPENGWRALYYPYIKPWLVPWNPHGPEKQPVVNQMYEGLFHGEPMPLQSWITPIAAWSVMVVFVFGGFLCLAAILRRQWVEHERLPFALVQLPLEMVRPETAGPFFRNKLTWIGFAIPAAIFTTNGLHILYPAVPEFSLSQTVNVYLPYFRPWSDMEWTPAYLSFAAVGFSYLLPTDLIFSLWFFFLLTRVQDIVASLFGMQPQTMSLYPTRVMQGYQAMGAYFVLVFYLIRISWPHLRQVARKAVFNDPSVDDNEEMIPYRVAVFGLIACFAGSIAWCVLAGMSLWMAALEMFVYLFIVAVVMARSVSEGGLLMTETSFRPMDVVSLFSSRTVLGPANLTVLSFVDAVFARDLRGLLLTGFMDGLRISDGVQLRRRSMLWAFAIAIPAAMLVAGALHLWIPYRRGAVTLYSYVYSANSIWGFEQNAAAMRGQDLYSWLAPVSFAAGAAFTAFLAVMRSAFVWWPFHPLGYTVSASWTMIVFWFPCLIAWAVKGLILRWGGMTLYATARPFFLGLVLGEFSSAVVWTVVSFITKGPAPFFPWP